MKKIKIGQQKLIDQSKAGFTIVELSLAIAFIASLLIFVAVVTSNILAIYQKGLTIKAINSVGRGLIDNLSSSVTSAPALSVSSSCMKISMLAPTGSSAVSNCMADNALRGYIYNAKVDSDGKQLYGVFCTGTYSYVWNTAYGIKDEKTISVRYNTDNMLPKDANERLTLARFKDPTRRVCTASMDLPTYRSRFDDSANYELDIRKYADNPSKDIVFPEPETNLLASNEVNLLLYELTVFTPSTNTTTGRSLYTGTFILATERGGINIENTGDFCQNVDENGEYVTSSLGNLGAEFNYCEINKFNFAARTAGGQ